MINGNTELIAHIGFPTHSFKSPLIYNPYFKSVGVNAVVVPFSCQAEQYPAFFRSILSLGNVRGALITMPHKVSTLALLDEISPAAQIAGACNAVKRKADGQLVGDMFDGEGFVRGLKRKGCKVAGAKVFIVGTGGVGCAIAASFAAAGADVIALFDTNPASAEVLRDRLLQHYPALKIAIGSNNPAGFDIAVNATPLGMNIGDPLPVDVNLLSPDTFVGEVVMRDEMTGFLKAAAARGCRYQVGTDMLFEQIPAYLEFFGFPSTSAEQLRALAQI